MADLLAHSINPNRLVHEGGVEEFPPLVLSRNFSFLSFFLSFFCSCLNVVKRYLGRVLELLQRSLDVSVPGLELLYCSILVKGVFVSNFS